MMQVSYSDLTRYQRCPKQHEYATVRELQPKDMAEELEKGILVHNQLMSFYLTGELLDTPEWDLAEEATDLVFRYINYYDDEWDVLHVEENFAVTLDTGDVITLTPDLIVREPATGAVWVVDHKTVTSVPSENDEQSLQALTYFGLLKEFYPDLTGFIFNYLRKKEPTQPRLTKTGAKRVAYLDTIDTDFDTLKDFLTLEAPELLDDPAHRQRLAELREENRFFVRKYVYISDAMIQNTMEDIDITIGHMDLSERTGLYHRVFLPYAGPQSCTRCPYKELCLAELRGYDTESIVEALYEPRDMSHKEYVGRMEEL